MEKLNFQQLLLQSSVSHDPSNIDRQTDKQIDKSCICFVFSSFFIKQWFTEQTVSQSLNKRNYNLHEDKK